MRFISVLSICVTTIFCSSKFKVDGEWSAQLANVFIDDNENAYILVDNVAYDYRGSRPKKRNFSTEDFTEEGLQESKQKMREHEGEALGTWEGVSGICSNVPTIDHNKQTIYSFTFEPINFMGYDYKKNPTLKCLVNKWPKKEEGKIQFKELAHVELTFESETDTEVNWKVVKMTKSPEKDVSDDEFKHFDDMTFKKAVYNLSDIKVKSAEWGFDAYSGEKNDSNKIKDVKRIDYNGTFIFNFDELLKKKVESIAYTSSYLPAGDLNVIDFMNENKKKD